MIKCITFSYKDLWQQVLPYAKDLLLSMKSSIMKQLWLIDGLLLMLIVNLLKIGYYSLVTMKLRDVYYQLLMETKMKILLTYK